jgi:hypothetical protein
MILEFWLLDDMDNHESTLAAEMLSILSCRLQG